MNLKFYENMEVFKQNLIFKEGFSLKKVGAILAVSLIATTFTACHNEKNVDIEETTSVVTTMEKNIQREETTQGEETTQKEEIEIYDFPFLTHEFKKQKENFHDWSDTVAFLKMQDENFDNIVNLDSMTCVNNHNFECAIYNIGSWGKQTFTIVDFKGNLLNDNEYKDVIALNDYTVLLQSQDGYHNTLLNQITGETKRLEIAYGFAINDDLFATVKTNKSLHELLYTDGKEAVSKFYENIIVDQNAKKVYLVSENDTEILDMESKKARKLENIEVKEANNNYLVCENRETLKCGVYYMESFYKELEEKIPMDKDNIFFLGTDTNPTFICVDHNQEKNFSVYSAENQKLSTDFEDMSKEMSTFSENEYGRVTVNGIEQLVNKYGTLLTNNTDKDIKLLYIVDDNTILFYDKDFSKLGLMDLEGNKMEDAVYNTWQVVLDKNTNKQNILLRNDEQNETVIYNTNKEFIARGDYSVDESIDILTGKEIKKIVK